MLLFACFSNKYKLQLHQTPHREQITLNINDNITSTKLSSLKYAAKVALTNVVVNQH